MITLSKIAKEAHVSVSTASKAFSGSAEVNEDTRNRIFDVAKRYGCFKKFFNATYSKYVIAVICPEFSSNHYCSYLSYLRRALDKEGCEICVAESNFSPEKEKELLDYYCMHADVDAIIVIDFQTNTYDFHEIPILFMGCAPNSIGRISIVTDISGTVTECVDYLVSRGVSSIGFIGEPLTNHKLSVLQDTLSKQELVLDDAHIRISQQRFEAGGYEAMEAMLNAAPPPRAVICAYDNMAIGAMKCIADHGLRIPEDIAVLGMDGIPNAPYLIPPLASISAQTEECCRLAVRTVIRQINGQAVPVSQTIPAKLQLRESFMIPSP